MTPVDLSVSALAAKRDGITYRRRDGHPRCRSSWTPRCRRGRGRQCPRARRGCAGPSAQGSAVQGNRGLTPRTLSAPISLTRRSCMVPTELPSASVLKLPRSPTWRSSSVGAPCVLPKGLTAVVSIYIHRERERERGRTVRAGGGAAVGVVTELVDVEGALRVGVVALDVPRDGGGRVLVGLLEGHGARDLGVSAQDSDWAGQRVPASHEGGRP